MCAQGTEAEGGDGAPKKAAAKGGSGGEVPAAAAGREEVVMRAPVHCDGCGRKLRRSLERLDWVGEVSVDSSTDTVVVRGPKAVENAAETVRIVERRTGGKAVLVSPASEKLPPAPVKKKETKKDDGNKDVNDLPEINMKMVVILRMNLHCDACCEEIKRRILRIRGVEDAVPYLKSSQMMVKGVVEPATLVGFIRSCTGRKAAIFRAEPLDPPPPPAAGQAAETKKEDTHADDHTGDEKKHAQDDKRKKEEEAPQEEKKGGGGGDHEDNKEEKPADVGGVADEEHEHEDAAHGGEGEKHAAAGRRFAAPLPAGFFTVAPPEMTMGAISNVTPYHHRYSYPSSAAASYYPYYAHPAYYQCQYPQQPYYYPPYMYGGYYPQPDTFTEENPNSCAIV